MRPRSNAAHFCASGESGEKCESAQTFVDLAADEQGDGGDDLGSHVWLLQKNHRRSAQEHQSEVGDDIDAVAEDNVNNNTVELSYCKDNGCGTYHKSAPCQCSSSCYKFKNCCNDYWSVCYNRRRSRRRATTTPSPESEVGCRDVSETDACGKAVKWTKD